MTEILSTVQIPEFAPGADMRHDPALSGTNGPHLAEFADDVETDEAYWAMVDGSELGMPGSGSSRRLTRTV
jgi:hypothetical protein